MVRSRAVADVSLWCGVERGASMKIGFLSCGQRTAASVHTESTT